MFYEKLTQYEARKTELRGKVDPASPRQPSRSPRNLSPTATD